MTTTINMVSCISLFTTLAADILEFQLKFKHFETEPNVDNLTTEIISNVDFCFVRLCLKSAAYSSACVLV